MIELHSVSKYYQTGEGRHYVLRTVNFIIPPNSNIALLGRNGAGKSTLLRMIGGAESPSEGHIYRGASDAVSWPMGLATGFQGSMTGAENVRFICRIYGLTKDQIDEVVEFVREFSEIGKFMDMPIKTYSSGMRARVMFGLSLSLRFDLYLVDELTAVGDFHFRKKARDAFGKLRERATIIFASHDLKAVESWCDAAIVLYDGEFQFFHSVKEGIANYRFWVNTQAKSPLERRTPDDLRRVLAREKKKKAK